jgi:hypothetical protein
MNNIVKAFIAGLLIGIMVTSLSTRAVAETSITLGSPSYHLYSEDFTNSQHELILIQHDHLEFGTFINSYDRRTYAVGYTDQTDNDQLNLVWHVGLMYGYTKFLGDTHEEDSESKVYPYAALGVKYDFTEHHGVQILLFGDAVVPTYQYTF